MNFDAKLCSIIEITRKPRRSYTEESPVKQITGLSTRNYMITKS